MMIDIGDFLDNHSCDGYNNIQKTFQNFEQIKELCKFKVFPNGIIKEITSDDIVLNKNGSVSIFNGHAFMVHFVCESNIKIRYSYNKTPLSIFGCHEDAISYAKMLLLDRIRITKEAKNSYLKSVQKEKEFQKNLSGFAVIYPDEFI